MSNIKKNFLYSSIQTTANYIFPLLTYPYVSRILGVTNIGICNFIDSVINYYILFSLMGITILGIRSIATAKDNERELSDKFSFIFWLNTISTAIILLLLLASIFFIPKLHAYKSLMIMGGIKVLFNYLSIDWFYKGLEDFKYIMTRGLIVRFLYVISIFIFIKNAGDYQLYYFLSVMMIVILGIINFGHSFKITKLHLTFSLSRNKAIVKSFFTLGFYLILTSMYTTFNVTYLGFVCGETEVGYYTTATKLHTILLGIFTAFTGVMLPRMSSLIHNGEIGVFNQLLEKSFHILLFFSIPLIAFAEIFTPDIISLISGKGYELAVTPMRIILPLIFIIGYEQIIVIQVLMPIKKDKAIFVGSCIGAATGLLFNLLLVKKLGSTGSAFVWLASEIAVMIISQYFATKYIKIQFPIIDTIKHTICVIPAIGILYAVTKIPCNYILSLGLGFIITLLYFGFVYTYIIKDSFIFDIRTSLKNKIFHIIK